MIGEVEVIRTTETPLTSDQVQRLAALREAAMMGKDATDTVLYASFILTGSDELPAVVEANRG